MQELLLALAKFTPLEMIVGEIAKNSEIVKNLMGGGKSENEIKEHPAFQKLIFETQILLGKIVVEKKGFAETIEELEISREQDELIREYRKNK